MAMKTTGLRAIKAAMAALALAGGGCVFEGEGYHRDPTAPRAATDDRFRPQHLSMPFRTAEYFHALGTFRNTPLPPGTTEALTPASVHVPWSAPAECLRRPDNFGKSREALLAACQVAFDTASGTMRNEGTDANFIALSITGGGTKSAIYSAEAMFALQAFGLLKHVDMISSVSGGSFTAALYAASCDPALPFAPRDKVDSADGHSEDTTCRSRVEDPAREVAWRYGDVMERLKTNITLRFAFRKGPVNPFAVAGRAFNHHGGANALASLFDAHFFAREGDSTPLRLGDLRADRPNLFLNATNTSTSRRHLESAAGVPQHLWRQRFLEERWHFSFVDHYLTQVLGSSLADYPLSYAVAASAAFPLIVDYVTLGAFPTSARPQSAYEAVIPRFAERPLGFVHLTDGGTNDNHGLNEVNMALRDVFGDMRDPRMPIFARQPDGKKPNRVLHLLLDSSLVGVTGQDPETPAPRIPLDAVVPFRIAPVVQAIDSVMSSNLEQRKRLLRDYMLWIERKHPSTKAATLDIGIETLELVQPRRGGSAVPDLSGPAEPASSDRTATVRRLLARGEEGHSLRTRLGLVPSNEGNTKASVPHPQCLFEATVDVPTSLDLSDDYSTCLRHAARWSTALRMMQLCERRFFERGEIDCSVFEDQRKSIPLPPLSRCPLILAEWPSDGSLIGQRTVCAEELSAQ